MSLLFPEPDSQERRKMSFTSEQWWEKKLNIRTRGKIDHFIAEDCNPYEPTDYRILQTLAESGYITADSHVLDYGCGLGRSVLFLSARTGCRATGIEFDRELYEGAVRNLGQARISPAYKKGIRFVCADARKYQVQDENCFYFFNPFADEVLRIVIGKIRESYYENPRQMYLFFYYPFDGEVSILMTEDGLQFVDEIDCTDYYLLYDRHERILIFEMI